MWNGYKRMFATREECVKVLMDMYRAIEETGFCEMALLDETLCTNPHGWGWKKLSHVVLDDCGTVLKVMDRPLARGIDANIEELNLPHEVLKILLSDNVERIEQLMDAYKYNYIKSYNGIGPVHEKEIRDALDEWQKEHM